METGVVIACVCFGIIAISFLIGAWLIKCFYSGIWWWMNVIALVLFALAFITYIFMLKTLVNGMYGVAPMALMYTGCVGIGSFAISCSSFTFLAAKLRAIHNRVVELEVLEQAQQEMLSGMKARHVAANN